MVTAAMPMKVKALVAVLKVMFRLVSVTSGALPGSWTPNRFNTSSTIALTSMVSLPTVPPENVQPASLPPYSADA